MSNVTQNEFSDKQLNSKLGFKEYIFNVPTSSADI